MHPSGRSRIVAAVAARILTSPDDIEPFLSDAAHYPGGRADEVCLPETTAEVATLLRERSRVLPVGVQSSLTGGATPQGGAVLSLARMNRVIAWSERSVRVEAGVVLAALEPELRARGL